MNSPTVISPHSKQGRRCLARHGQAARSRAKRCSMTGETGVVPWPGHLPAFDSSSIVAIGSFTSLKDRPPETILLASENLVLAPSRTMIRSLSTGHENHLPREYLGKKINNRSGHLESLRADKPARLRRGQRNGILVYLRMLHGKGMNRIPGIILPHGEYPAGPQATKNIIYRRGSLSQRYVMEHAIAENQIEILLRNVPGGGSQFYWPASDRFVGHRQRLFRCVQPYDLLRVKNVHQQRKRHSCATTKIHHPFRCDSLLAQEVRPTTSTLSGQNTRASIQRPATMAGKTPRSREQTYQTRTCLPRHVSIFSLRQRPLAYVIFRSLVRMASMASLSASAEDRRFLQPKAFIFEQSKRTIGTSPFQPRSPPVKSYRTSFRLEGLRSITAKSAICRTVT